MTHSLHRQGSLESLRGEYIVLSIGVPHFLRILQVLFQRKFSRMYSMLIGVLTYLGIRKILRIMGKFESKEGLREAVVLSSSEELYSYLKRAKEANTGKSIVVSGVFDEVNPCLKKLGLCPHTVQLSLGIFGRTDLLPEPEVLELTTMCGHHMVSPRLVEAMARDVGKGKITPERAAQGIARLCSCGIFNEARAVKIIKDLAD